jgi:hypothetical protein
MTRHARGLGDRPPHEWHPAVARHAVRRLLVGDAGDFLRFISATAPMFTYMLDLTPTLTELLLAQLNRRENLGAFGALLDGSFWACGVESC